METQIVKAGGEVWLIKGGEVYRWNGSAFEPAPIESQVSPQLGGGDDPK